MLLGVLGSCSVYHFYKVRLIGWLEITLVFYFMIFVPIMVLMNRQLPFKLVYREGSRSHRVESLRRSDIQCFTVEKSSAGVLALTVLIKSMTALE